MKKILYILFILLCCGCSNDRVVNDVDNFKKEYEGYNNEYIELDLENSSIIKYSDSDEINKILESGSGVIFIGSPLDNVSRRVIDVLLQVASGTSLDRIYYIDNIDNINDDVSLGDVLFILDGKVINKHSGTIDNKLELNDEELLELYNIYSKGIHDILGDTCDERC